MEDNLQNKKQQQCNQKQINADFYAILKNVLTNTTTKKILAEKPNQIKLNWLGHNSKLTYYY